MSENDDYFNRPGRRKVKTAFTSSDGMNYVKQELLKSGITKIEVEYDGSNDDGSIQEITFFRADGVQSSLAANSTIEEIIEKYVYELLPSGWEINEGSFGKVTITLKTDKVHLAHNERYESSRLEESDTEL